MFPHERVLIRRGPESGLPIIVAVHSTALGQALGGCRMKEYPDWRDGLEDALRLSAAMSEKCALAGMPHGGGKTVVVTSSSFDRTAALHDVGTVIEELNGLYATGPDVGTGPADMLTIAERTSHVFCRPADSGGSGDSSPATALGTVAALRAVCAILSGQSAINTTPPARNVANSGLPGAAGRTLAGRSAAESTLAGQSAAEGTLAGRSVAESTLAGRSFAVLGLGHVGKRVARLLAEAGAKLVVSDIDPARREVAAELGATWATPDECLTAEVDVLVPAALGGLLTPAVVPALRCTAIAGPANNQLDAPSTADLLHARGILWAPDYIVSAGGVLRATAVELHHETPAQVTARLNGIATTLTAIFETAERKGITPAAAAAAEAQRRINPTSDRGEAE
ncbi:Glu/Leu/Phe/Val dehydrogenase dimerization domain-containing protein [Paractinoplanes atraurantiacus]|uniref:Leucine dehydrogenase n=1 Tax=Paractinoplanes atraurantiacus TaxID=1036182 RepID=A0A285HCP9_9ACTN|nr:Glu/Leu/Phe/Val dehydrogenase dimerization domain-containing protein [Actinoplanes atraurantiacus]SNY33505.1 leucine dehydrogenase [Actinoplanes atraurantiacus]